MTGTPRFDTARWQARLDELCAAHQVPGASLAVLTGESIHELASGVLHRGTGVEVTADSVFQIGSITKVYTATLVMGLVDEGLLDLDARVVDVLPDFAVADPQATAVVTVRQLLSHTSGISGDFTHDTGRGDDCLARYVEACARVGQDCPPGASISYSSTGYNVLGRIVEVLTGQTWDAALRERICVPLGLTSTVTLPEEVLRFRAAMGHLGEPGRMPEVAPAWNPLPRSSGPYGGVLCATAADVVRFARMHLDGGTAPDGTRLLSAASAAAMRRHEVEAPDRWTVDARWWGLGWAMPGWEGGEVFGHDGATIGQRAYLRVVPGARLAVALLTNSGTGAVGGVYTALFRELLAEFTTVRIAEEFAPGPVPVTTDIGPFAGRYLREGVAITVGERESGPYMVYEFVDGMKDMSPPIEVDLVAVSGTVFAGRRNEADDWMPVVFSTLADGAQCVHVGMRAAPKAA